MDQEGFNYLTIQPQLEPRNIAWIYSDMEIFSCIIRHIDLVKSSPCDYYTVYLCGEIFCCSISNQSGEAD